MFQVNQAKPLHRIFLDPKVRPETQVLPNPLLLASLELSDTKVYGP